MRTLLVLPLLLALTAFAQPPDDDVQGSGVDLLQPPPSIGGEGYGEPPPVERRSLQAPTNALPPGQPITRQTIDRELTQYGRWVNSPDYGEVWTPTNVSADWKPYVEGRWVPTPQGWSFSSTAPWALTFHYGRWGYDPSTIGWYWVPGREWAPAWVTWKVRGDDVAWAPLAPRGGRPDWHAWSATDMRNLGRMAQNHLLPDQALARIIREGRRVDDLRSVVPMDRRPGSHRGYGRRPAPYER